MLCDKDQSYFFHTRYLVVLILFVEKGASFLMTLDFFFFGQKAIAVYLCIYFCTVPLICSLPIQSTLLYLITVALSSDGVNPPLLFFFKIVLLDILDFYINFKISLLISYRNCCLGFWLGLCWICRSNWRKSHLNNITFSIS